LMQLVEFDLRSVHYEVKSARCHEMLTDIFPNFFFHFFQLQTWPTTRQAASKQRPLPPPLNRRCRSPVGVATPPLTPQHELCVELVKAVEAGDSQAAAQHASALARQKAALSIQLAEKNYASGEISSSRYLPQVFVEYGFHPRVQRWVMGQCLCTDPRSLASYGVQRDGDTAYLYLISARQARITRQLFQQDLEGALSALALPPGNVCANSKRPALPCCEICATAKPDAHVTTAAHSVVLWFGLTLTCTRLDANMGPSFTSPLNEALLRVSEVRWVAMHVVLNYMF
uniref:SHANK-associated RH domain interacting protein n=1 Tax=Hippocampus comes TaxID=109280 RepID=A0A3Q2YP86_HIPCM